MLPELGTASSLTDVFRTTVRAFPGEPALSSNGTVTTYGELDGRSEALAARIRAVRPRPGQLVGVLADRSPGSVTAVLAILKAGHGYVPLDPSYPADRLRLLMRDTGVSLVVGRPGSIPLLGDGCALIDPADQSAPALAQAWVGPPAPVLAGTAYVIHTSGSTGTPKGCLVTHANVMALLRSALPLFNFKPQDRWTLFHSLSFDFSVWEMWGAFATGGTLVTVPLETARSPESFADLLATERVSVLSLTPSAFGYTSRACGLPGKVRSQALSHVVLGGERVDLTDVRDFLATRAGSGCAVTTMYGITEVTVHATFKRLGPADLADGAARSPIGRPLPHIGLTLHDGNGKTVEPGETGEIWISGPTVAAGYLGREELSHSRFSLDPGPAGDQRSYRSGDLARALPDGQLDYVGRVDDQLKVMGFRIEPGEIESALRTHPGVRSAVVVAAPSPTGPCSLVACVVPEVAADPVTGRELRAHLGDRLPRHLVPQRLRIFDEFPRTASGKTDRNAVLAIVRAR